MRRRSPARYASARSPPPAGNATAQTGAARPRSGAATRTSPARPPSRPHGPAANKPSTNAPTATSACLGEQRCPDCATFARRIGPGGPCPHCDEPVAITDLTQEVAIMPSSS